MSKESIDMETGIDPVTGKQRLGLEGGYDFDEYKVDSDSDGVMISFGTDEIEIERSDWDDGRLVIKVNDDIVWKEEEKRNE